MTMSDPALGAELLERAKGSGCCGPDRGLLTLLREDADIYRNLGSGEVERLWAFVLACVTRAGLAQDALPFILEELETGTDPYSVAAAARACLHLEAPPAETAALLVRAMARIRHVDEFVELDRYPVVHPVAGGATAVSEIEKAVAAVGMRCRAGPSGTVRVAPPPLFALAGVQDLEMEDQDGRRSTFRQRFAGRACLFAFFYTRCMNPDKCSRTVSQLGQVVERLADSSAVVAGITYDPAYDGPERLRRYGEERGLRFGPACSLLRPTGPFEPFRNAFELGVGYGSSTVNRHRVELSIVGIDGSVVESRARRLWEVGEVAAALQAASFGGIPPR